MSRFGITSALCAVTAIWLASAGDAQSRSRYYDLGVLLDEPHPLAAEVTAPDRRSAPVPIFQRRPPARVPAQAGVPPYVEPAAPPSSTPTRLTSAEMAQIAADDAASQRRGFLSEIRLGALIHDEGPFSRNEESGYDGNLEVLFTSPKLLDVIWSPRPHIGLNVNSDGDTSQAYLGLSWEWSFLGGWFAGFSLGGAVHNGELKTSATDRKELGCRLLFRESIDVGYRFGGRHGISLFLDHISNANICSKNEGLENFGLRYGYRF